MKSTDIAKILNISQAAVSLVKRGKTKHCGRLNLARITALINFEKEFLYSEFKQQIFRDLCDVVILKASARDGKNYTDVRRLAMKCRQWSELFSEEKNIENANAWVVLGLDKEPFDLFTTEEFWDLCEIAQRKSRRMDIIEKSLELQNAFKNLKRKIRK